MSVPSTYRARTSAMRDALASMGWDATVEDLAGGFLGIVLRADDDVWILSDVFHSPNLGNGVHEATATREDSPSQAWPVRLSNVQARAARYVEVSA